ncbi:MAG TPA: hypothetical protein VFV89_24220 [Nocardioides sp.]|uniref:hypothetical protein n=1 Tax=Nocardioides sp. TaxID=35761 RepID=UPI002E310956|nr:hypothetical protein [Nocardioides sp.]HEX5090939.1 hypothetical protein [Nocardioides sp.]
MPPRVDVLLLFGGSLPDAWDAAASLVEQGRVGTLVLVGGEGRTPPTPCTSWSANVPRARRT